MADRGRPKREELDAEHAVRPERERTVEVRKSGFVEVQKRSIALGFSAVSLGQSYPQHCPYPDEANSAPASDEILGPPLNIHEVSALIGCSAWTIRQRYLPAGLPHFRLGRSGKLTFYRNQVTRWVLRQQVHQQQIHRIQKGGIPL